MPLNHNGGDRKSEEFNSALHSKAEKFGNSKEYLLRRLSRDNPEMLDKIEAERAKERQLSTLKQNTDKINLPERANGQARDKAASKIGNVGIRQNSTTSG